MSENASQETDETLMMAHVGGDQAAFPELFKRHSGWVKGYFMRRGATPDKSFDLMQQTFLHVHRARADYQTGAKLKPWLFTIALNVYRSDYRSYKRSQANLDRFTIVESQRRDDGTTWERHLLAKAAADDMLKSLNAEQQKLIKMRWIEEMSHADIARETTLSENAVKMRLHRAMKELKKLFMKRWNELERT